MLYVYFYNFGPKLDLKLQRCSLGEENSADGLVQLPIYVVLTNSVTVSYFCDYLTTVGGQNYIDCYLAIEVLFLQVCCSI